MRLPPQWHRVAVPRPGSHGRRLARPQEYFLAEDPAKLPDWHFWEQGPYAAGMT